MSEPATEIIVGIDTHADTHVAVAIDHLGRHLGELEIPTTAWLSPALHLGRDGSARSNALASKGPEPMAPASRRSSPPMASR